jgi:hypothetical protein
MDVDRSPGLCRGLPHIISSRYFNLKEVMFGSPQCKLGDVESQMTSVA